MTLLISILIYLSPFTDLQLKFYIKQKTLIEYFGNVCHESKPGDIVEIVRVDQRNRKKKMESIFKVGKYINLSDSVVQCILDKNKTPNYWYDSELEKFPKSYYHIELLHESTPILGYYYVALIDKKGKIKSIEKFGYGR